MMVARMVADYQGEWREVWQAGYASAQKAMRQAVEELPTWYETAGGGRMRRVIAVSALLEHDALRGEPSED